MAFGFVEERIRALGTDDQESTPTTPPEPSMLADALASRPVSFITGVIVAPDYSAGTLSVEAGVKDVLFRSASIGTSSERAETPADAGVAAHVGVDFGPLPSVEGHVEVSPDGTVTIGGEVQATLPMHDG